MPDKTPTAVIDIGSNSVRLVIYDGKTRTPLPLVNEKVLCGLARGIQETGALYKEGKALALGALERFARLLKAYGVKQCEIVATSAMRDATDGPAFAAQIKKKFGFTVSIISGQKEAQLAASGVLATLTHASGVIGDMGGGSLELATLHKTGLATPPQQAVQNQISFPIGALRLKSLTKNAPQKIKEFTDPHLEEYGLEAKLKDKQFYAVGGGFRALAKLHIRKQHYPLHVIQHYEAEPDSLHALCQQVSRSTAKQLVRMPEFSEERAETAPYAAAVLARIITLGKPRRVVFSTHGVREGLVYSLLPQKLQISDPLLSGAANMVRYITPSGDDSWVRFGESLYDWLTPLFPAETESQARLRRAACLLSHLSWQEHLTYRAEMAFRTVLDSELVGLTHQERVFLALCVFHRYQSLPEYPFAGRPHLLLDAPMRFRALVTGVAMRLAFQLSQGASALFEGITLALVNKRRIELHVPEAQRYLINKSVEKRLQRLSDVTGLPTKLLWM